MPRKKRKTIKNMILASCILGLMSGIVSQATIRITSYQNLKLVGTSGSVYRNTATGTQSPPLTTYLYSGIRRGSSMGYSFGSPVGGNQVYLTAYSPNMSGAYSEMQGTATIR